MQQGPELSPAWLTSPIIQGHGGLCWERGSKPMETHILPGEAWKGFSLFLSCHGWSDPGVGEIPLRQ